MPQQIKFRYAADSESLPAVRLESAKQLLQNVARKQGILP
jgi:hypothetical protein